jgi:hypothetical protein
MAYRLTKKTVLIIGSLIASVGRKNRVIWEYNGAMEKTTENRKIWDTNGRMGSGDCPIRVNKDGEKVIE